MTNLVRVVPAEGARIRQPNRNNAVMSAEGDMVNRDDVYYERLILSGDLIVKETPELDAADEAERDEAAAGETAAPAQAAPTTRKFK